MTELGAAGLVAMIALADRRVIALLVALIGFLVSSRRQGKQERVSLFVAFAQALGDIAVNPRSSPRQPSQRRKAMPASHSAGSLAGPHDRDFPGDGQHTKSSV